MSVRHKTRREVVIGGGRRANYPALLLFLVGALLGMLAVYLQLNHGRYGLPLAGGLLCALAALFVFAAKKDSQG